MLGLIPMVASLTMSSYKSLSNEWFLRMTTLYCFTTIFIVFFQILKALFSCCRAQIAHDFVQQYMLMTLIIVLTVFISSGIPLMYPICFGCILIMYNLNKFALFREKPQLIKIPTTRLATKSINFILFACILHLIVGLFAIFDSTFKYESFEQMKVILLEDFSQSED